MGYDDDSFSFAENKKRKKKKHPEVNNSIIEFEDGESVDDTYYGYSIEDISAVKPKNIRRRAFFITAAVVLLLASVLTVFIFVFRVREIVVENNSAVSAEKIAEDAGIRIGMHIYAISKGDIEKSITDNNPYIKSVRVKRRFPGTLRLIVEENRAYAYYASEGGYAELASDLSVVNLTPGEPQDLIKLIFSCAVTTDEGSVPEFADGNGRIYLSIIEAVCGHDRSDLIDYVDLSDRFDIKLGILGRYTVFIGNRTGISDKLDEVFRTVDYLEAQYGTGVMVGKIYVSGENIVSFLPE